MKWNWNMTSIKLIPFSCCAFTSYFYFCFCASPDILCSIYNYIAIIIKKIDVKIKWNSKISIIYFYRNWGRNISNDIRLKLKYVARKRHWSIGWKYIQIFWDTYGNLFELLSAMNYWNDGMINSFHCICWKFLVREKKMHK